MVLSTSVRSNWLSEIKRNGWIGKQSGLIQNEDQNDSTRKLNTDVESENQLHVERGGKQAPVSDEASTDEMTRSEYTAATSRSFPVQSQQVE